VVDVNKSINKRLLICKYIESKFGHEIYLQRYLFIDSYKFIFYHPMNTSKDYALSFGKGTLNSRYEKVSVYSIDSAGNDHIVGEYPDKLLNISYIPKVIEIKRNNRVEFYYLNSFNNYNYKNKYSPSFLRKLTIGPISEDDWWK